MHCICWTVRVRAQSVLHGACTCNELMQFDVRKEAIEAFVLVTGKLSVCPHSVMYGNVRSIALEHRGNAHCTVYVNKIM